MANNDRDSKYWDDLREVGRLGGEASRRLQEIEDETRAELAARRLRAMAPRQRGAFFPAAVVVALVLVIACAALALGAYAVSGGLP